MSEQTAEQQVKAKCPDAHCAPLADAHYPNFYVIRATRDRWAESLGSGDERGSAWADALRRIEDANHQSGC